MKRKCNTSKSEENIVNVGYGGYFYYGSTPQADGRTPWYNSSDAAKAAAEADARQRLLNQYSNATSVAVSSDDYFIGGPGGYWYASATGTIPAKPVEKDNTEKVTTGYGVVTDCVKRAKDTAKKKLKKNYPGVKDITTECERTPEGGFVAKADGVVEKETKSEKQTKTEKGIKMKTKKVVVENGQWFCTYQYGTIEATRATAEEDAKRRLLMAYPNAVNIIANSIPDLSEGYYAPNKYYAWCAWARGEVPADTTEQDNKQDNRFGYTTNQNPSIRTMLIPIGVWFKNKADAYSFISILLESQFGKSQGKELVSYKVNFTTKLDKQLYERGVPISATPGERIECTLEVEYITLYKDVN